MDAFQKALAIVFRSEGGVSNKEWDDGGLTNLGITQETLNTYRLSYPSLSTSFPTDVRKLNHDQAATIYHDMFWCGAQCDRLPAPLAIAVFDYAVNSGPKRAIERLQRALRIKEDGVFGAKTADAANNCNVGEILDRLMRIRFMKWIEDDDFKDAGAGWLERGARLCRQIGQMMGEEG